MKILEPKPPPTSGAITRSLCSGATPMKADSTRRATRGCWPAAERAAAAASGGACMGGAERGGGRGRFGARGEGRVGLVARVVLAHRRTRLQGVGDEAVVD